jgi:splicing factor 45
MMSLYANLLDSSADNSATQGTISRAPVVFKQAAEGDTQQDDAASKKQQISAGSKYTLFPPPPTCVPI